MITVSPVRQTEPVRILPRPSKAEWRPQAAPGMFADVVFNSHWLAGYRGYAISKPDRFVAHP